MNDMTAPPSKATLTVNGKTLDLPILKGTTGPDVVDVRKLYADADVFTFDPGFTSTASCESKITYIDGDAGILLHRGYSIQELEHRSNCNKFRACSTNSTTPPTVSSQASRACAPMPLPPPNWRSGWAAPRWTPKWPASVRLASVKFWAF